MDEFNTGTSVGKAGTYNEKLNFYVCTLIINLRRIAGYLSLVQKIKTWPGFVKR